MHPYYETNTTPAVFTDQIKFLFENDYTIINLYDTIKILKSQGICQEEKLYNKRINKSTSKRDKYAVITFDDGFRDFYTKAFPILQEYGYSATVFLPTAYIGDGNLRFKEKECMTWGEIHELQKLGIQFGSHTVNHPELYELKKNKIEFELKKSKEKIDNTLGESIKAFSYPFALPEQDKRFIKSLREILQKCGYKYGVTTRIGTVLEIDNPLFLKRVPINSYDDLLLFKAKLEGAYDWIYNFQLLYKKIKNILNP
jgi:peptidoglycan/xylan/chitin deacetylase (PgdA/CDA1 family)